MFKTTRRGRGKNITFQRFGSLFIVFSYTSFYLIEPLQVLKTLGLTLAEAKAYYFLVIHGPQRVYALARRARTAPANVYQALDSLLESGGVVLHPGRPKVFRAVPPGDWLPLLASEITSTALAVAKTLENKHPPAREAVNEIRSKAKLFRMLGKALGDADRKVLVSASPPALEHFHPLLDAAGRRGVEIVLFSEGGPLGLSAPPGWLVASSTQPSPDQLWVVDDRWALRMHVDGRGARGRQILDPVFARALGQGLLSRMAWTAQFAPDSPQGRRVQRLIDSDE